MVARRMADQVTTARPGRPLHERGYMNAMVGAGSPSPMVDGAASKSPDPAKQTEISSSFVKRVVYPAGAWPVVADREHRVAFGPRQDLP